MISSNILSPEGFISFTTILVCASSIATFSDQAFSFSFNSFVSLHFLGNARVVCRAMARSFHDLGAYPSTSACWGLGSV